MSKYQVLWVADSDNRRDYKERQFFANEQGAKFYLELHYNASAYDKPGTFDNPCSAIVCDNASVTSQQFANHLSKLVSDEWGFPNRGVDVADRARAGYWNLYYTNMPAVLTELLYVSDLEQARLAQSEAGQQRIAELHYQTIKKFFPNGGKIALSIGHMFKVSSIHDRGAPVAGTQNLGEADLALAMGLRLVKLLESDEDDAPSTAPENSKALEQIATGLEQAARGVRMLKLS